MTDNGFDSSFRLLSAKDFSELKIGSSSYKKASFIIYYKYKKNLLSQSRVGFSVPKKIGKAHRRNRLKRIIREFFRTSPYKYLNCDILFVVSWSKNLANEPDSVKESMLMKNLREFFHFLEDDKLRRDS